VYWLQHPPYLRWAAAALILIGAAAWEFRPRTTHLHPFLTEQIEAGDVIGATDVEWREVPSGLLPLPDLSTPVAASRLSPGTPLLDPLLTGPVVVPDGWWTVPVQVGEHARPGDTVLLVVTDPPIAVSGTVIEAQSGDPYSIDYRPATVAVPQDAAPLVAAAASEGYLVAAVRPDGAPLGGG
jgi:hypothetical protein